MFETDTKLCKRIIEKNFPEIRASSVVKILGGWASDVFEVNGDLIFRFPKWPEIETGMQKEISLLPELAKSLSVQVPNFEFIGTHDNVVFVGYRKILGLPLASCDYRAANFADQLGWVLTEIHRFQVQKAIELKVPSTDWRREYAAFYGRVRDNAFPLMSKMLRRRAAAMWEDFLGNEGNFRFKPVFIHRDLSGDAHILCDPGKGEITGIIDWEDASIGDPAIDFTGIYWDCGKEFTKQVMAKYGGEVDKTFWERTVFYYKIGAFHHIEYGQLINDDTQIQDGLKHLSKVLR